MIMLKEFYLLINYLVLKSNYLKKNFSTLLKTGHGTDLLSTDPTDPKTWGDGKQNKKKFIESSDGKKYMQEIKKIKKDIYKEI